MDGNIQVLQKTPSQSTGGSAPTSVNTSRSLPLENARAVTMETTPTPLSYWPPLSSTLPSMNSSKEVADDPQNHASQMNNSYSRTDLPKSSDFDHGSGLLENKSNSKSSELSHSRGDESISNVMTQPTKTLHHNLPPIAGITSSHNYRGAREVLKLSQANSADGALKPRSGKLDGEENSLASSESKVSKKEHEDLTDVNKVSETKKLNESQKSQDKGGDRQILEVSPPPLPDRPNTADGEHKFSVPAIVSSTNQPKSTASPRAPTPFVHTGVGSSTAGLPLVQENVSHSTLTNCSSSPSNRTVPSPHFINPHSMAPHMPIANMQRSSPSENSRMLASPHSNLSSPSNSSHTLFNSFAKSSSLQPPIFPQTNSHSSQRSESSLPYAPDSNSNVAHSSSPKTTFKNSSPQNLLPESGHNVSMSDSADRKRIFNQSQNSTNKITRPDLPNASFPSVNSNILQRSEQSLDNQTCRNPFELPVPKLPSFQHPRSHENFHAISSSSHHHHQQMQQQQHYHHHHQQQQQQQQQSRHSFNRYPHNVKLPTDPNFRPERLSKDPIRSPVNAFSPAGCKQGSSALNERDSNTYYKERYKLMSKSATSLGKDTHPSEALANDISMQRGSASSTRSDMARKEYPEKLEMPKIKGNETDMGRAGAFSSSECISEFGNRNSYVSALNVNKNFNKVNGNEYSGLPMSNSNYQDLYKQGFQPTDKQRYNLNPIDKHSSSFNAGNQANSVRPAFLPMPQPKYDLNRQIYNSMLGGSRNGQPSIPRSSEKMGELFPSSKDRNEIILPNNTQSLYSEQDKTKTLSHAPSSKSTDYVSPGRMLGRQGQDSRSNFFEQAPGMFENRDIYQNKKMVSQPTSTSEFLKAQPSCEPIVTNDHHRPLDPGMKSNHNFSQNFCYETFAAEKNRQLSLPQSRSLTPPKQNPEMTDYDSKKLDEMKLKGTVHRSGSQNPQQLKSSCPNKMKSISSVTMPPRPKRESPLDLSVKTVRQSADSTAKDDNEALQNLRLGLQSNHSSENRYSVSHVAEGSTGAPKIDFTPNFSGFNSENSRSSTPLHHNSNPSILPPVESFKKSSNRMVAPMVQEVKNKQDFSSRKYFLPPASGCHKHQSAAADHLLPRNSHVEAQKRPSTEPLRNSSCLPKIPKVDSWKLAFDQQIEQRLNLARINYQNSQMAERTANVGENKQSSTSNQNYSSYHIHKHSNVNNHYGNVNMYPQPPVQTSATPYNPSYIQQPRCQPAAPQTPQEKFEQREYLGNSPDPEQIIKQISKGVMPDHKLLQDKNVLSILRSSLEEKEAKLMQLKEAARRKEKYKELMVSEGVKKPFPTFEPTSCDQNLGKDRLPPFGALNLERICAPPSFPGHKLNVPRPVDTVKIDVEPTQKYFNQTITSEGGKGEIPSPYDNAQGPPADLDGLAAFLAARIRTKGELKQVDPAMEFSKNSSEFQKNHSRPDINPSAGRGLLNSQDLQYQNLSSRGSPPKLVRESRLLPPLRRRVPSHEEEDGPTTSGGHPKEYLSLPPRDPNGIRSSSEASVFDFKESDSEGEMPVLERQTLEGMRRDRKTYGSKQNVSTTTPDDVEAEKTEIVDELDKSRPDPFWNTAFDMFLEQLEKRPPKRSSRKKKSCSRNPYTGSETEDCEKGEGDSKADEEIEKSKSPFSVSQESKFSIKKEEPEEVPEVIVKKEPEEQVKTETVHDGHVKLSSSRLKNYRDELLKEEKVKKLNIKKESEKSNKNVEKPVNENTKEQEKQKSNTEADKTKVENKGVKTRGKSKDLSKSSSILEYDTDTDGRDFRSDTESTVDDDDDSLSLSGLESESTDSELSQDSSASNYSSNEDSENERTKSKRKMRMETRLQARSSRQRQTKTTGMRLRSKPVPLPKAAPKSVKRKRKKRKEEYYPCGKKKKPSFGDGSDFRPGWEEECYKFKQQLRMPEKLISISRPPKGSSVSLPDLDPYRNSPSFESSDVAARKKPLIKKTHAESEDSDFDGEKQKSCSEESSVTSSDTLLKSRNGKKSQSNSIINMLVNKYGKRNLKKRKDLKAANERKSPRILPKATNKPELLPTPSLGIGKENLLKDKKKSKDSKKKKVEEGESMYLGYFRKKTVNNFKEAFKQKVGMLPQEFGPVILKSRTRTQTRDMKKRATLVEVFGEERPASAPPLSRGDDDISTDQEKVEKGPDKKKPKIVKKVCGGVVTRGRGKLTRSGRPGLRSTAMLRSNKAVQISKRHLNSGRKRNMELLRIRAMASKKFSYLVASSEGSGQLPITKKRLKLRSVRRKFRSGFDYIRKKKKLKKDGDSADGSVKEKRLSLRPTSENVEDIQCEIRNWVINKGLGETILHRAARLGYTDVAAYCLEKMDCSPSPRDNAGYTPLHEACSRGHLEIAKLLLMYGASVSESAKGGVRPLHEAAENGFTELIRLLLSFGADPLLETYTGHTALSLVTDEEARRLIQHHLADVQGNVAPVWTFQGPSSYFDPPDSGYDPLSEPPSPDSTSSEYELEVSESMLPPLYRLTGDRDTDCQWILLKDLLACVKTKSKDSILKQLGSSSLREMKLSDFNEQGRCCNLLGAGDKFSTKSLKVTLVPYDDKVRRLLGVEKVAV